MTRDQAYETAIAYLKALAPDLPVPRPEQCYSEGCEADFTMDPGIYGEKNLPEGPRDKVWAFAFQFVTPEPGEVVSGGGGVVFVDDATGICSYQASL